MGVFIPSDPQNHLKTQAELRSWKLDQEAKQRLEKMETRRFIITTIISAIAALAATVAAVASVISCFL